MASFIFIIIMATIICFIKVVYDFSTSSKIEKKVLCKSTQSKQKRNQRLCGICLETKKPLHIFSQLKKCGHTFCNACMLKYVKSKIKENIALVVCPYPNCKNNIEPAYYINILPKEIFSKWTNALCEASISESEKYYCPYKDCSALMVNDSSETITQAECPSCHRLFCASCRVKWHVGIACEEYGKLKEVERGNGDLLLKKLAKEKKWKRCSNCSYYVEKSDGCNRMTCRCRYEFCYICGVKWSSSHNCNTNFRMRRSGLIQDLH